LDDVQGLVIAAQSSVPKQSTCGDKEINLNLNLVENHFQNEDIEAKKHETFNGHLNNFGFPIQDQHDGCSCGDFVENLFKQGELSFYSRIMTHFRI